MHVTETAEKQSQPEQPESTTPTKQSSRKSVLALAVFALGINTTAAIYTLPTFDIPLPNVSSKMTLTNAFVVKNAAFRRLKSDARTSVC